MLPSPWRPRLAARPRRTGRAPHAVPAVLAALAVTSALTGCSGTGGSAEAGGTTSTPPSSSASSASAAPTTTGASASSSSTRNGGTGCDPNTAQVPAGAAVAPTADLDLDGAPDELWLADDGGTRLLGVRTATGNVFSTEFTSASPIPASAVGQRLEPADTPQGDASIVLLSTGRSVALYAVVGCELVPSQNEQGQQYTFDLGFTGYGTGVVCAPPPGGGSSADPFDITLYGVLLTGGTTEGDLAAVQRTRVELTDDGRQARNGRTDEPAELQGIAPDSPQAEAARSVSCGDQGPDTAVAEPQ